MKILLVRSRYVLPKHYFPRLIDEPLGLEYLAASVRYSHEVEIFDSIGEGWNRYLPDEEDDTLLYQGADLDDLQKAVDRFKPDVIGITWLLLTQNKPIIETVKFIKSRNKNIPLIVGGPYPSASPVKIMKDAPDIDVLVFGEGEATLNELLDKRLKNLETVKGIVYRRGNEIIQNPAREFIKNIDDIPAPARDMTPYQNYSRQMLHAFLINFFRRLGFRDSFQRKLAFAFSFIPFLDKLYYFFHNIKHKEEKLPVGDIMTSRGCPNNCVFCAVHAVWKHTWRPHSVKRILEEIDYLVYKQGVKRISISDDNFNISKENIIKICKAIVNRKYNIVFEGCPYLPALDDEVLGWLKKAGFRYIGFPLESGNQEVLDKIIRKRIDLKKVPGAVESVHKIGLKVWAAFIIGLPGETIKTMHDTVDFAKRTGFDAVKLFIYQPFPSTDAYEICEKKGYLTKDYNPERAYLKANTCFVKTEEFSPEDVLKIAKEFEIWQSARNSGKS